MMSDEAKLEALLARLTQPKYGEKASIDVVSAIEWELSADKELSRNEIGAGSGVGFSTIEGWLKGTSSPTLRSIQKVARALHATGPLSDYLTWMQAGRRWRQAKERELEDLRMERRRQEVEAAARSALESKWSAATLLEALNRFDEQTLETVTRGLMQQLKITEPDKESEEEDEV